MTQQLPESSDSPGSSDRAPKVTPKVAVLTWILDKPAENLSLLGLATYLVFRVSFLIYYERFGVTPEEVGLDYLGVLAAQAGGGLLEIFLAIVMVLCLRRMMVRRNGKVAQPSSEEQAKAAKGDAKSAEEKTAAAVALLVAEAPWLSGLGLVVLIAFPLIFLTLVVLDASRAGTEARAPTITEPFQGRAMPVTALWIDPSGTGTKPRPVTYADLGRDDVESAVPAFLLLGVRESIVVLFDRRLGVVRLPHDKVLLVAPPRGSL